MTTVDIDKLVHEHTLVAGRTARAAQLQGLSQERLHQRQRDRLPRDPRRDRAAQRRHRERRRDARLRGLPRRHERHVLHRHARRRTRATSSRWRASRSTSASPRCARARGSATSARAIQEYVEAQGCSVVRDFVGHGIGRKFHDAPQVKHYGKRGTGERLRAGMTFTIEPMVNLGGWEVEVDPSDKWTVRTADGSLSAQFEHTVPGHARWRRDPHGARARAPRRARTCRRCSSPESASARQHLGGGLRAASPTLMPPSMRAISSTRSAPVEAAHARAACGRAPPACRRRSARRRGRQSAAGG